MRLSDLFLIICVPLLFTVALAFFVVYGAVPVWSDTIKACFVMSVAAIVCLTIVSTALSCNDKRRK